MVNYDPFWETLKKKGVTIYHLITHEGYTSSLFTRMKKNQPITTETINKLCLTLECDIPDIVQFINENEQ